MDQYFIQKSELEKKREEEERQSQKRAAAQQEWWDERERELDATEEQKRLDAKKRLDEKKYFDNRKDADDRLRSAKQGEKSSSSYEAHSARTQEGERTDQEKGQIPEDGKVKTDVFSPAMRNTTDQSTETTELSSETRQGSTVEHAAIKSSGLSAQSDGTSVVMTHEKKTDEASQSNDASTTKTRSPERQRAIATSAAAVESISGHIAAQAKEREQGVEQLRHKELGMSR